VTEPAGVALFWGDDEYLLRQAALDLLHRGGLRPTEVDASEWRGGETSDLATPSLWGERRALLVTRCQGLPPHGAAEVKAYVEAPSPEATLVLTLVSRAKTLPPLARAIQTHGGTVRQVALKRQDLPKWVRERAVASGLQIDQPGAAALVGTVGEDAAALDRAVEQLAAAFAGQQVGADEVRSQFRGLGEQQVWDLCDRAFTGRLSEALVILRSLLEAREDPLLILGGIAARLRDLLRVKSLPERLPPAEAARAAGVRFDWQVRRYREQTKQLTTDQLVGLHRQVTDADRALKGGAAGDLVLASVVTAMAGVPGVALDLPIRVGR
jgi:DNA polymerase III subunit delta